MHLNKNTTTPGLSAILDGLLSADVEFILVGGLAAIIQGSPITTLDVDIVHDRSVNNISKLYDFLKSVNAIYRRPDDKIIEPQKDELSGMGHTLLSTNLGKLDILAFIEEHKTYEDLCNHTIEIDFRGHALRVLDIKTLVEMKRNSNNPKDKQRLSIFEETLRQIQSD